MIATDAPTIRVVEHTYTAGLTPRGEAVVQLIRRNWLRDLSPINRRLMLDSICIETVGLLPEDRVYLGQLVEAHQH